jgi:small nuclear ribonucleoprotein (snRNP)-like protein
VHDVRVSLLPCRWLVSGALLYVVRRAGTSVVHERPTARALLQEKSDEQKARDAAKKAFMCQRAAEHQKAVQLALDYDPIQTIIQRVRKGPLMLLRRAYQCAVSVDVVTRHARGIKGVMRGQLHGFDKFMNLLLADVEEWMAHRTRVLRIKPKGPRQASGDAAPDDSEAAADAQHGAHDEQTDGDASSVPQGADKAQTHAEATMPQEKVAGDAGTGGCKHERTQTRVGWQQVLRRRQLSRLLLRGDQVVTIALAAGPMRLPATLAHLSPADEDTDARVARKG